MGLVRILSNPVRQDAGNTSGMQARSGCRRSCELPCLVLCDEFSSSPSIVIHSVRRAVVGNRKTRRSKGDAELSQCSPLRVGMSSTSQARGGYGKEFVTSPHTVSKLCSARIGERGSPASPKPRTCLCRSGGSQTCGKKGCVKLL